MLPPELMPPGTAPALHQQPQQQPQQQQYQQQELSQLLQQGQHGMDGSSENFALPPLQGEGGSFAAIDTGGNVPI